MPTATGRDVAMSPTDAPDIPPGGAFFNIGPDSSKELLDSLNGDCAKLDDPKCSASLDKIFGNDDNNLVGRNLRKWFKLGKALGSLRNVFFATVAYLTMKLKASGGRLDQGQGLKFHLPSHALSAIQGASTATKVVYKTADNDPSAITAILAASATASGNPEGLFNILDADAGGHHKGDIEITAPSDEAANALNDFFKKGKCPAAPTKRGMQVEKRIPNDVEFDVDCVVNEVQDILNGMEGNGPLGGYRDQLMQLAPMQDPPHWANERVDEAWRQVLVLAGERMPDGLGIRNERIVPSTRVIFSLAIANYRQIFMVSKHIFIEAKGILSDNGVYLKCPDKSSKWFPKCQNFVCQGKDGRCTTNFLRPCECDGGEQKKCPKEVEKRVCSPQMLS